ncbi:Zinc homeostasis factor 1 [Madurella mycetomatis]|uniref:Zinc homeostasis factor 1 n=1 Tax=Madurella mycetomatis TaxID=100816 RepID=A0A175W8G5_9PEZI|nr:Zinc homeostasis factor 1 [Madurella mycetomatis]
MADAFHYLNDPIDFIVTLTAITISERSQFPQDLSFDWQRARLLGAFFNGTFLLALGTSIFLQSAERFISVREVDDVKLVLIMGSVSLLLNLLSAAFLHRSQQRTADTHLEHRHTVKGAMKAPMRALGMLGAMPHVVGDALNNLAVIIAVLVIWFTTPPTRFYADPAISMSAPRGVDLADIKHDMEKIPGIESVHELHVWRLN